MKIITIFYNALIGWCCYIWNKIKFTPQFQYKSINYELNWGFGNADSWIVNENILDDKENQRRSIKNSQQYCKVSYLSQETRCRILQQNFKKEGPRGIERKLLSWLKNIREWIEKRNAGQLFVMLEDRQALAVVTFSFGQLWYGTWVVTWNIKLNWNERNKTNYVSIIPWKFLPWTEIIFFYFYSNCRCPNWTSVFGVFG